LTRGFLKNGFKNIVAIGGDGLINEVANGFFICTVKEERVNFRSRRRVSTVDQIRSEFLVKSRFIGERENYLLENFETERALSKDLSE
jgi:hypothetical protein